MDNKANKSIIVFNETVEALNKVLSYRAETEYINIKSNKEVLIMKDKLENCSVSATVICDKSSVEICQNEGLLEKCQTELQAWVTKFGPSKGSCLQAKENCCSCITNLPSVSKECLGVSKQFGKGEEEKVLQREGPKNTPGP